MMGEHSKRQLQQDLRRLGVQPGDLVLMHSSFRSLGGVEDGAAGFFDAFLNLLGPQGTLVLPALSYQGVTREQPKFDLLDTPSCVGYLPEFFRTQVPDVVRSLHATHSCCMRGKWSRELAEGHELDDTPVGVHSPFHKLARMNGKLLMLGCGTGCNTSMHGVEETVRPPYLFGCDPRVEYELHDGEGGVLRQSALRHSFTVGGTKYGQCYSRLIPLLKPGELAQGTVLSAQAFLLSAEAVWRTGGAKLAEEPFYFVEPLPDTSP